MRRPGGGARRLATAIVRLVPVGAVIAAAVLMSTASIGGQSDPHELFDRILDTYVRDGRVYYRALESDRASLDRYVRSLDVPAGQLNGWSPSERKAFWINAYNALVLTTVIDAYPIRGQSTAYPSDSIRQIPGAFERTTHRVAGERLTLDAIEARLLREFNDPRVVLALGRGARGSGRLRSEAFRAGDLDAQLDQAVKECVDKLACISVDAAAETLTVSPLFSWHADVFEHADPPQADGRWSRRSPIERAVAALVFPYLLPRERDVLLADRFAMRFGTFDWSLNEL